MVLESDTFSFWCAVVCVCTSPTLCDLMNSSPRGSSAHGMSQCWSGLPFSSPVDLPDLGIKAMSLKSPALAGGFFIASASWEAHFGLLPAAYWL